MKRRQALSAGGSVFGIVLSGCLGGGFESGSGTPTYDCEDAERPSQPPSNADLVGDPAQYTYPERPDSLSDVSAVRGFVASYERAYRLNSLQNKYGASLEHVSLSIRETSSHEAPEGAAAVQVKYHYGFRFQSDGNLVHADPSPLAVAYYLDDAVLLRAVAEGSQDDEPGLQVDPVEKGHPVDCF